LFGQEVAPGLSRLVAVASAGLFPQPFLIRNYLKELKFFFKYKKYNSLVNAGSDSLSQNKPC
jgi:hypothetical protein